MEIYFAPLEGITGYIYRKAYEDFYSGIDCYYSPFLVTRDGGIMKKKERKDVLPENNPNIHLVPQLLTNKTENFIGAARQLEDIGYEEINLNVGCPSGTVCGKGRGAGFLKTPDLLDGFLEKIFESCSCAISVKTRIGYDTPEEFEDLLKIYNQYPISNLIIHPRTRMEFYKGSVHKEIFRFAYEHSKNPLCYNGDVNTIEDLLEIQKEFPDLKKVMIGRGLIGYPGFFNQTEQSREAIQKRLQEFTSRLLEDYRSVMSGDIHALFKMKEIWIYMAPHFTNYERYLKKIKKTNKIGDYLGIVSSLFANEEYRIGTGELS